VICSLLLVQQTLNLLRSDSNTVYLIIKKLVHCAHAAPVRGISYIFEENKIMHRAPAARQRGFDSVPSPDPDPGRCGFSESAGSSKIKIGTSSPYKANSREAATSQVLFFKFTVDDAAARAGQMVTAVP
jgi:hypothetical protein